MPIHAVRRVFGLPALVAVDALAVVGCGADPGRPASAPAAASPSAPAPAGRPLTAEQLVAAALPGEESPDAYGHPVFERKSRVNDPRFQPSDPACGPTLAAARAWQNSSPAPAVAQQTFNWKGDIYGGMSILASYRGIGAKEAFAQVSEGLKTCRYYEIAATRYKGTVTVAPAPRHGDEAVQFEVTAPTDLGPHVNQFTVVRVGSVVVTFTKLSVGGHVVRAFPPALIDQQVSLLQQAQN
ncbi:hypothetical protein [Streptomyces agglomeratus]|uniref:hypothetical protein n=1 Tax=Streptomyces agglomeratus TaxID=285458 RepID=UPI00114CD5A3|nr:hypothetical protein [Streptomyces agglomeratus]